MTKSSIQNDFSFYRRTLNRLKMGDNVCGRLGFCFRFCFPVVFSFWFVFFSFFLIAFSSLPFLTPCLPDGSPGESARQGRARIGHVHVLCQRHADAQHGRPVDDHLP